MSENNYKEWAPGLVALHTIGDQDLALRTENDTREYVAYQGRWRTEAADVGWAAVAEVWGEAIWIGSREAFLRMRDDSKSPADLLRMAREDAQTPKVDSTVVIFGERYVKASDSQEALAQAEATIVRLRQEARRACVAAERFGIYQSRADVAAESLASKMVDLRHVLQGARSQYRDDLNAIRSVLGEPGGSVDLCVGKFRAYQEEIDDLRAEIETHKRSAADAQMRRDDSVQCHAAEADSARAEVRNLRSEIDRLRARMDDIPGLLEGVLGFRPYEITAEGFGGSPPSLPKGRGLVAYTVETKYPDGRAITKATLACQE